MILSDIAAYLKHKQQVSQAELSVVFGMRTEVIEPMVAHFVRKGMVSCRRECLGCQKTCAHCEEQVWYQWKEV